MRNVKSVALEMWRKFVSERRWRAILTSYVTQSRIIIARIVGLSLQSAGFSRNLRICPQYDLLRLRIIQREQTGV